MFYSPFIQKLQIEKLTIENFKLSTFPNKAFAICTFQFSGFNVVNS